MKKNSLSFKTLIYLILFSILILLLVWLIQVEFLEVAYERHQMRKINSIGNEIIETDKNDLNTKLENYAYDNNICIQHYKENEVFEINMKNPSCKLSDSKRLNKYKSKLINSDDIYIKLFDPISGIKMIIYEVELNDNEYIFLSTTLEDISSATQLLRSQLIYIIIFLIILSIIASIFITNNLTKPIVKLTNQAKELSKGNYNVKFDKTNIEELDELGNVLTIAASEMNKTDELKRDLIANVSHDLKTPLTMIKAYAEMLRDLPCDEEKKQDSLNVIISESDRLNVLVNDLLDLSKIEAGVSELNITEYDLVKEINEILKKYDLLIEKENYNFEIKMPKKAIIKADKSKLNQVIYNLINNAVENTGEDKLVKIEVIKNKDTYSFSVTNTGKGLTEEEKVLVWNKYYKKEKNHKRNVIGSGIGLSIVKNVLEQHNFTYGIDSKENEFTKFYFNIK